MWDDLSNVTGNVWPCYFGISFAVASWYDVTTSLSAAHQYRINKGLYRTVQVVWHSCRLQCPNPVSSHIILPCPHAKTSHRHHRFLKIFVYVSRLDFYLRLSWWKAAKDPSTHIEIKQLILFDLSKPNIFRFLEGIVIFETSKQAFKKQTYICTYMTDVSRSSSN